MKVLLTGASGLVGGAIIERSRSDGDISLRAAVRSNVGVTAAGVETTHVEDLTEATDWSHALAGCDAVIHAAGRVHVSGRVSARGLNDYRRMNVAATRRLARQSVDAGVRRFVFISSIKVNGERTQIGRPYTSEDVPAPVDAYGISKYEAEEVLRRIGKETGLETVIVRPVLVYGPGVKANFLSMMRWLHKKVPLPFGAIDNRRSLVAVSNLADLIVTCLHHSAAANRTFLVSDGEDLSTTELLRRMGAAMGLSVNLFSVPSVMLRTSAAILGKRDLANRLCESLQVDITNTATLLKWNPPENVDVEFKRTANHFLRSIGE